MSCNGENILGRPFIGYCQWCHSPIDHPKVMGRMAFCSWQCVRDYLIWFAGLKIEGPPN